MIIKKSLEEIEKLRQSNILVSKVLGELAKHIKPGITTKYLDTLAEDFIRSNNAEPAFLGYSGFPNTLCTSINNQVVHGIPSDTVLKEGDIVSLDCGVNLNGWIGDSAYTFAIGDISDDVKKLLQTTKESLYKGIEQATTGKRIGDIGFAVQEYCEKHGYTVVREMVGHGLGKKLHEAPEVPNYGKRGSGPKIVEGMVICIEPMINMGSRTIIQEKDGWTIRTNDKKPSAHFEHAIAIVNGKADILSTFDFIKDVLGEKEF